MKYFAIALLAVSGYAATVNFGTGIGLPEGNSLTGVNVATIPDQVYQPPIGASIWESVQTDSTNPPIANGTTVNFWFTFSLPGLPSSGMLGVMVDDSARGWMNGQLLYDNFQSPEGKNCAASLPNCLQPLWIDVGAYLLPGENRFETTVSQDGGGPFAIDVYGSAEYVASPTPNDPSGGVPEPASFLLLGAGLVVVGLVSRARRK